MDHEMLQALGTASTMLVLLRHADRVKIGCATGGLNALCRTDREHAWKGAAHYPFVQLIRWARGVSLQCPVVCETVDVPAYAIDDMNQYGGFTGVKTIQAAAALEEAAEELTVFVINADPEEEQLLTLDLRGFEGWRLLGHLEMAAAHPDDADTWDHPDTILPRENAETRLEKGCLTACLRKESWNVFRFTARRDKRK